MDQITIVRVPSLPAEQDRTPSTIYITQSATPGLAEMYFTGNVASTVLRGLTKQDVTNAVNEAVQDFADIKFVQNIAERNAINWTHSGMVLVLDATGDPTVHAGSAAYLYQFSTQQFTKFYEFESLDINLAWDNVEGRPNSTPGQIDDAVAKSHMHNNLDTLELYGKDGSDNPTFNGKALATFTNNNPGAW